MVQKIMDRKNQVTKFLIDYGFPTKLNGYQYTRECLCLCLNGAMPPTNKIMFVEIAKKFHSDAENIERCLQTVVDKMWKTMSYTNLFPEKPTIRAFITRCAEYMSINANRPRSAYDILLEPDNPGEMRF
jgi:hypothetical protein